MLAMNPFIEANCPTVAQFLNELSQPPFEAPTKGRVSRTEAVDALDQVYEQVTVNFQKIKERVILHFNLNST